VTPEPSRNVPENVPSWIRSFPHDGLRAFRIATFDPPGGRPSGPPGPPAVVRGHVPPRVSTTRPLPIQNRCAGGPVDDLGRSRESQAPELLGHTRIAGLADELHHLAMGFAAPVCVVAKTGQAGRDEDGRLRPRRAARQPAASRPATKRSSETKRLLSV